MRIDSTSSGCVFAAAFLAWPGVSAHGLVQDPPARNWFCGAVTKPDQVQNGVAQYPVCGEAFFAPGIEPTAGYSFMSVLTHTTGRQGVGPRTNVCGFNSETWNGAADRLGSAHRLADHADDRGSAQFHLEHLLGAALLGHLGLPLLDHEVQLRVADGPRAVVRRFRRHAVLFDLAYNDATPNANPNLVPDKANATFLTRCTVPARSGRHVIYAEWGRTPPTFERFHGCIDAHVLAARRRRRSPPTSCVARTSPRSRVRARSRSNGTHLRPAAT